MKHSIEQLCKTCRFSRPADERSIMLFCQRYPPLQGYPKVRQGDWCGEWKDYIDSGDTRKEEVERDRARLDRCFKRAEGRPRAKNIYEAETFNDCLWLCQELARAWDREEVAEDVGTLLGGLTKG